MRTIAFWPIAAQTTCLRIQQILIAPWPYRYLLSGPPCEHSTIQSPSLQHSSPCLPVHVFQSLSSSLHFQLPFLNTAINHQKDLAEQVLYISSTTFRLYHPQSTHQPGSCPSVFPSDPFSCTKPKSAFWPAPTLSSTDPPSAHPCTPNNPVSPMDGPYAWTGTAAYTTTSTHQNHERSTPIHPLAQGRKGMSVG